MNFYESFKQELFNTTDHDFDDQALALFDYQYHTNEVYSAYCKHLKIDFRKVVKITDIPFLPIGFFTNFEIKSEFWTEEKIYRSSGTTSSKRSQHFMRDVSFYHQNTIRCFEQIYGPLTGIKLFAILPSYQQQGDSSLISMVDQFLDYTEKGSVYFLFFSSHRPRSER